MNKLESMQTTGIHESRPRLASASHHFQSVTGNLVLFPMEPHVRLAKNSEKLKERKLARSGEVAVLVLPHPNKVNEKAKTNVHELL